MAKPFNQNSINKKETGKTRTTRQSAIPKNVANRMAKRIVFTTGFPTLTGMGVFIASYILVSKGVAEIPPALTLVISAGCFFLGLLGLSYGLFSASWENSPGSLLGLENIRPNIEKVRESFKKNTNAKESQTTEASNQ